MGYSRCCLIGDRTALLRFAGVVVSLAGFVLFGALASARQVSRPRAAAAGASTTWTLIQGTCGQGQMQVGRGCWDQPGTAGWTVSDGSATFTDPDHNPPTYDATFGWSLPGQTSDSGGALSLSTTANDVSNNSGLATQICVSGAFQLQGNASPCATAFAQTPGTTDGPHTANLTLVSFDASPGTQATVSIGFGAGSVNYTYRASAPAPPPTFEMVRTPSAYGQTVTAPAPAPGGAAVVTSPALAMFGAVNAPVSVDVEGLSVRDQVIANVRHDCFVQFVKAIKGLAALRLQTKWSAWYQTLFKRKQSALIAGLASCLAYADAYAQQLYGPSADFAQVSCADSAVKLTITGSGRNARLKSFHFADRASALKVTCTRHLGGITVSVSTRSRHTPLSKVVGSRLRIGIVRAKSDTSGGQLSVTFKHV